MLSITAYIARRNTSRLLRWRWKLSSSSARADTESNVPVATASKKKAIMYEVPKTPIAQAVGIKRYPKSSIRGPTASKTTKYGQGHQPECPRTWISDRRPVRYQGFD